MIVNAQSKSIEHFRRNYRENSNLFFYKSTLNMLNSANNEEFSKLLDNIEEIRVLNYSISQQSFTTEDIKTLKKSVEKEGYNQVLLFNEKGNTITLYNKLKKDKTVGFLGVVENRENLIIIDLIGSVDINAFMELKKKIDSQKVNVSSLNSDLN